MIVDVQVLDDFVYLLEGKDQDYLLFAIQESGSKDVFIHMVQAFHGEDDLFEFGEETFSTKVWVADDYWLDQLMYAMVEHIAVNKIDPENPVSLYHSIGGVLRSPPKPNLVPYNLIN